jgi:hypothetical protein
LFENGPDGERWTNATKAEHFRLGDTRSSRPGQPDRAFRNANPIGHAFGWQVWEQAQCNIGGTMIAAGELPQRSVR